METTANSLQGLVIGGKFCLRECAGEGASGSVYAAEQIALGRTVAVKILKRQFADDPKLVRRFHDEALAASRLNHPNTVSVLDYGQTDDGLLYIVMEYLNGRTFTKLIADDYPIPILNIVDMVSQVLTGLEEAHAEKIIHADLKSDNLVIEHRRGGWNLVKVVDFGIARIIGSPQDTENQNNEEKTISGTPEYMAPEIVRGIEPTVASDLYAVGIVLYELLVGHTPFVHTDIVEILTRHIKEKPVAPSMATDRLEIPPMMEALVLRALSKDPNQRPTSATEFKQLLADIVANKKRESKPQTLCVGCGVHVDLSFKFCPQCGTPMFSNLVTTDSASSHTKGSRATAKVGITTGVGQQTSIPPLDEVPGIWPLPIVGRESKLASLIEYLRQNEQGLITIEGQAGVGKTRVLSAVYSHLTDDGMQIIQTAPDPSGLQSTYYPIRAMIAAILQLPAVCSYEQLAAVMSGMGLSRRDVPGISELFGNYSGHSELESSVRQREITASAVRVLRYAALQSGLIVVFEDVHKYDEPSQKFIYGLAEQSDGNNNIRAIMTCDRDYAQKWQQPDCAILLQPLLSEDLVEVAEHLRQYAGDYMPDADTLLLTTNGNGSHIHHLIRYLNEGGEIANAPKAHTDIIAARIDFLPQEARVLLQLTAVFGAEISITMLRSAAQTLLGRQRNTVQPLDNDLTTTAVHTVDNALDILCAREILYIDDDIVGFVDTLVGQIVVDATPAHVRRQLHHIATQCIHRPGCAPGLLGHHLVESGKDQPAFPLLIEAGDSASYQGDISLAIRCYERSLHCSRRLLLAANDTEDARAGFVKASVLLAESLRLHEKYRLAKALLEEATTYCMGETGLRAQIFRSLAHIQLAEEQPKQAEASLRSAISQVIPLGKVGILTELFVELSAVLVARNETHTAQQELEECISIVTVGEGIHTQKGPKQLWRAFLRLAELYQKNKDTNKALSYAKAAYNFTKSRNLLLGQAQANSVLADCYFDLQRLQEANTARKAALAQMRALGDRRGTAELLLREIDKANTLQSISSASLREAKILASEVGWSDGLARITQAETVTIPLPNAATETPPEAANATTSDETSEPPQTDKDDVDNVKT